MSIFVQRHTKIWLTVNLRVVGRHSPLCQEMVGKTSSFAIARQHYRPEGAKHQNKVDCCNHIFWKSKKLLSFILPLLSLSFVSLLSNCVIGLFAIALLMKLWSSKVQSSHKVDCFTQVTYQILVGLGILTLQFDLSK